MFALCFFFFLNDTAPPEIYPLPLHAALPISAARRGGGGPHGDAAAAGRRSRRGAVARAARAEDPERLPRRGTARGRRSRSEEHTSELQSRLHLVCRLLLEKKKKNISHLPHRE